MAKEKQFDVFLGGSQSLPHEVPIMKVVAARASEISSMTYSIENPEMTKLIFQKLPIYMRRRAMSHNVKRLPRKLREAHLSQMAKSGLPPKSKRPSRKHRRRPSNILSEYNRRQLKKLWLETHIWHAKRFHMVDRWGYRIANHPNNKCFRANYRAATEHCLLQDISYYTCIEINGEENLLKTTLMTHCKPFGLSFASIKYMNGCNEGTLMFFRKNSYPQFPIGNVHFLWRPKDSDIRTIWIWVHPAFYTDILSEITSNFGFKENDSEESAADTVHNPKYLYINDAGCKMTILRNALNRFRLYGPLTLKVLTHALQVPSLTESGFLQEMNSTVTEEQDESLNNIKLEISKESIDNDVLQSVKKIAIDEANAEDTTVSKISNTQKLRNKTWHIEYYKHQENREAFKVQKELWEELKTSEEIVNLPESVIGLTILDPRFYLCEKRMKHKKKMTSFQFTLTSPTNLNCTPIWNTQIRRIASSTCLSTGKFNVLRSKCLVPGVANDKYYNEDIMAKIPILLIPRPGSYENAFIDSGIDIIIPAGWAMPIWLALVQQHVRVGALRESKFIAFESSNPNTPDINDPDSSAYMEEASTKKEELTKKYFRYPPNRRANFSKLGITSPFFCNWKILIKEWSGTEDFYVLRDRTLLLFLQAGIRLQKSPARNNNTRCSCIQTTQVDLQDLDRHKNCLVRVKVSMTKGVPSDFAIICIPTSEDLKKLKSDKRWIGPEEQCHVDSNEATRKVSRKNHLLLLKRLRRQRVRQKKLFEGNVSKLLEQSTEILDKSVGSNNVLFKIISEQLEKMSKLYLPKCVKVRYSCDREVIGYVTTGDFSLVRAKGIGIGYVVLPSLVEMINKKSNVVLIRNTETRQYKLATLDLLGI